MAEILKGFGMKVLAYDVYLSREWAKQHGVEYVAKEELFKRSDVISIHVPLMPDTKHFICRETLEQMKPGAILINVSRGGLIDTVALIESLKSGHLGGVGMDGYQEEGGIFFEEWCA